MLTLEEMLAITDRHSVKAFGTVLYNVPEIKKELENQWALNEVQVQQTIIEMRFQGLLG